MCGIYGFVSSPAGLEPDVDGFLRALRGFVSTTDDDTLRADGLSVLTRRSYALIAPAVAANLLSEPSKLAALRDDVAQLRAWSERFEGHLQRDDVTSQRLESLNQLMMLARDLIWRLEVDVLANLDRVAQLGSLPEDPSVTTIHAAWNLNLAFNAIDRLEVRGRDSAGIALVLRLASADAIDELIADENQRVRVRLAEGSLGKRVLVRADDGSRRSLVFSYKVAEEVGKMGDNVRALRAAVRDDSLLWSLLARDDVETQLISHTRWASNGVISVPNCHPVDGALLDGDGLVTGAGHLVAALNGDIDNYQELRARYRSGAIEASITTDAKIIPVVVDHHYRDCGDLATAFQRAFAEFEGSMAIALVAADRPGELLVGQKGSGQGLYIGRAFAGVSVASELYGLVELTSDYLKLEGERTGADGRVVGEALRIRQAAGGVVIEALDGARVGPVDGARFGTADITTRDIDRGAYTHYLAKEIDEAVSSVEKTLRGRYDIDGDKVTFRLGTDSVPEAVIDALKDGTIRRVEAVGQGTAAVAAAGVAHLLREALAPLAIHVRDIHASELSGHHLDADRSDTLIVAVSQSGTTTDTNRTVDMMRKRGAHVISIVNRRNSDLVFRSDGVIYTSDGRDVEMSVASTKAFYSQNVAGRLLSLYLAARLGTMTEAAVLSGVQALQELPQLMRRVLATSDSIADAANLYATQRKHWAIVGSGIGKVAADEIRIKLSELCYKSIAIDFLEDKKHIDLSSEPLILICANGLPAANVSDVVKEVAIFRAHEGIPIVVTEEGEDRFDPYAATVLHVPVCRDVMAYLLSTMVGHLFGYHAARRFDRMADDLRRVRTGVVRALEQADYDSTAPGHLQKLIEPATGEIVELADRLASGEFDSCLEVRTAVRLSSLADLLLERLHLTEVRRRFERQATVGGLLDLGVEILSHAIAEAARPIDAIKHQAKTVTVGISRTELKPVPGLLWEPLSAAGHALDEVADDVVAFLNAFQPLVAEVKGVTRYFVEGLDAVGRPARSSLIRVLGKTGSCAALTSRADAGAPLTGTKWSVVKDHTIYLGRGQADGRRVIIFSLPADDGRLELFLYHVEPIPCGERRQRMAALRALPRRHDRLMASVTERNLVWSSKLVDRVQNDLLFFRHADEAAAAIVDAGDEPACGA